MAFFRALETAEPPATRLFDDPLAAGFLGPGLRCVARLCQRSAPRCAVTTLIDRLWPGARPAGIARTRLIDDILRDSLGRGIGQVVILGAGFDARAQRLPCLAGPRVFEVDQPATLAEKRRRLDALPASRAQPVTYVPVDFNRQRLAEALAGAGFDAKRATFFLWEGVTNYLSAEAVDAVMRFVASAAAGSRLLFTYVHRDVVDHAARFQGTWLLRRTLRRAHEPWTFGLDPSGLTAWLRERGLALVLDEGSLAYRERYLGRRERLLRGYEFYRAALAAVRP